MRAFDFKKRMKNFFCDRIFSIIFGVAVIFLLATLLSVVMPIMSISRRDINAGGTTPIGDLYDNQILELDYYSTMPGLRGMTFTVATYTRVLTEGTLYIVLSDEKGNEVFRSETAGPDIHDNSVMDIPFPEQSGSKNQDYTIRFFTSGIDKNHAITFWANGNSVKGTTVSLNGVLQPEVLVFSLEYNEKSYRYTWDLFVFFDAFAVLTVVSYGRNRSKK